MENCRLLAAVLVVAVSACAGHAWQTRTFEGGAYQFRAGSFDLEQMQTVVLATPGATRTIREDRSEIVVPAKNRVYLFTLESNAAHPSAIILTLEPRLTPFEAYSGAETSTFDAWLVSIGQQRDQIVSNYLGQP